MYVGLVNSFATNSLHNKRFNQPINVYHLHVFECRYAHVISSAYVNLFFLNDIKDLMSDELKKAMTFDRSFINIFISALFDNQFPKNFRQLITLAVRQLIVLTPVQWQAIT